MDIQSMIYEMPCYICGQIITSKHSIRLICKDEACRLEHIKRKRRRRILSGPYERPGKNSDRPWGEPSLSSLLIEIDQEKMSVHKYADMFNREISEVHHNLKKARRLGFAGLAVLRGD